MNRILFEEKADGYRLAKGDPRLEHARGVLRAKVGDVFDIGVVNGPTGKAKVERINAEGLQLSVIWGSVPPGLPPIHLLVGLSRPQTMKKILQEATAIGVSSLHITSVSRSDPAYRSSRLWKEQHWLSHLIAGAEQAFDTRIPELFIHDSLEDAAHAISSKALRILLDVYSDEQGWSIIQPETAEVFLAIGPERGWTRSEQQWFREHDFHSIRLSDRVLRVETAVVSALTLVQHRLGISG